MDAIRAARMLAAAAVLLLPLSARAAVFVALVGDDPACGYRTSVLPNALQSAIDAVPTTVPPGDFHVVHVARSGSYVGTRVLVEDRSLRIEGGYATCASALPGGTNTTIDATGAIGGPVRVRGTTERETVYLAKLTLRGGSGSTGSGISIRNATVSLERVIPTGNSALRGGGIELEGTGLGATVVANGTTRVIANTATQEGGGISCTRGGLMQLASSTEVSGNAAATSGGGIFADGCAGYANVLARSNSSAYGGFLFTRSGLGPTTLTLGLGLGPDDLTPALLTNEASVGGGAIFASGDDTVITIKDAVISGNRAGSIGGGIVANTGAQVEMTRYRRLCARGDRCSALVDNSANYGGGALANFSGTIVFRRTFIEGNSAGGAGSAASVQGSDGFIGIRNSLVAGNAGPSVLQVRESLSEGAARLVIDQSTIAGNLGATSVIRVNPLGTVRISHSIVNDIPTRPAFSLPAGYVPETECSMFHEIASAVSVDPLSFAFSTPGFADAANGNYRLRPTAEATDLCPAGTTSDPDDFEFDLRPVDAPLPNVGGPYDVGFDEYGERILSDGFETSG